MNTNCDLKPRVVRGKSSYDKADHELKFYSEDGLKAQVHISLDGGSVKVCPQGNKKYGLIAWRMYSASVHGTRSNTVELRSFGEMMGFEP